MMRPRDWIAVLRLRTLPLSLSGLLLTALVVSSQQLLDITLCLTSFLAVASLQILSNFANDYGDGLKGSDKERAVQDRMLALGVVSVRWVKIFMAGFALSACFFSVASIWLSFGNFQWEAFLYIGFVALSVWAAMAYTMGRRPYGYRALGDVFVFVFFGLLNVCGGYYLLSHRWDIWMVLPAISVGALSVAVLNLNNIRDLESDKKNGKITLPVIMGVVLAKRYQMVLVITAVLTAIVYKAHYFKGPFQFIFLLAVIPGVAHLIRLWRLDTPAEVNEELSKVAQSTFLFSVLFGLGEQEMVAYWGTDG